MRHDGGMSIRMQEWGMMRAPADAIHIPVRGLVGWDSVTQSLGEGVSAVLKGSEQLVQGQESVQKAGELARFSRRLDEINEEARAELADRDVKDWNYSWRAACESRLNEAVGELPPAARQAGEMLAKAYSEQASLKARRDAALETLDQARGHWRSQLESAVQQGDEQQALLWVERGKEVFVAPAQEEEFTRKVRSLTNLSRWEHEFSASPLQALERWMQAAKEDLPSRQEETARLKELADTYLVQGRKALAAQAADQFKRMADVPGEVWERARRSGLISPVQYCNATSSPRPLREVERCRWFRKVDEVEDDDASRLRLQLELATAPLPVQDRDELMQRLSAGAGVERTDRLTMSRNLWNLYNAGAFGCPGDDMAGRRLAAMQRQGTRILSTQGAEAAASWLQGQGRPQDRWVCYSDLNK